MYILGSCFNVMIFSLISCHCHGLRVGIIGGGIGGTATAYFLRGLFKEDTNITIFESHKIGGRLATRAVGQHHYEVGGAIAISRNKYVRELAEKLGLKKRNPPGGYSCLYDGEKVVFAENQWHAITVAQLLWRYGLNVYFLNKHIGRRLDLFDRIYHLQDKGNGYENVTSLLHAMDDSFVGDTMIKTGDGFKEDGFSDIVIDDLVGGTIQVNNGQDLNVHKFVGGVSVAGAAFDFFAIEGGNWRIAERLMEESRAIVINQPVTVVKKLPSGLIEVTTPGRSDIPPDNEQPMHFDFVVVATPQTADMKHRIKFQGFPDDIKFNGMYHRTVTTLLRGQVRIEKFAGAHSYTDEIIVTKPVGVIKSISRVYPVSMEPGAHSSDAVWKVFSSRVLTSDEIANYFIDVSDVTVESWLAYPNYGTDLRQDKFELSSGLYHLNAVEWAASAMEMSVISARNIANLMRNAWCHHQPCSTEEESVQNTFHSEL